MSTQKFSANDANKKKIRQLEKDIKLMKKDLAETFSEAEKDEKKKMLPIYIGIGVLFFCALILAALYFYLRTVM